MDQCHRSKTDLRYFSLVHIIHLFAQRRPMALLALVRSVALLRAFFARISVQKFQRKMRGMNTLPDACSWACGHLIQTCRKKNCLHKSHGTVMHPDMGRLVAVMVPRMIYQRTPPPALREMSGPTLLCLACAGVGVHDPSKQLHGARGNLRALLPLSVVYTRVGTQHLKSLANPRQFHKL